MNNGPRDIPVGDDDTPVHDAFAYLKLYADDVGETTQRTSHPEFANRKPHCVSSFTTESLELEITNSGLVVSDLLIVEHQFSFCTARRHGAGDGFSSNHFGEVSSDPADALATAAAVPPQGSIKLTIPVPEFEFAGLVNLYFRCRLATLRSSKVPKDEWDFGTDPRVTEAHLRVI